MPFDHELGFGNIQVFLNYPRRYNFSYPFFRTFYTRELANIRAALGTTSQVALGVTPEMMEALRRENLLTAPLTPVLGSAYCMMPTIDRGEIYGWSFAPDIDFQIGTNDPDRGLERYIRKPYKDSPFEIPAYILHCGDYPALSYLLPPNSIDKHHFLYSDVNNPLIASHPETTLNSKIIEYLTTAKFVTSGSASQIVPYVAQFDMRSELRDNQLFIDNLRNKSYGFSYLTVFAPFKYNTLPATDADEIVAVLKIGASARQAGYAENDYTFVFKSDNKVIVLQSDIYLTEFNFKVKSQLEGFEVGSGAQPNAFIGVRAFWFSNRIYLVFMSQDAFTTAEKVSFGAFALSSFNNPDYNPFKIVDELKGLAAEDVYIFNVPMKEGEFVGLDYAWLTYYYYNAYFEGRYDLYEREGTLFFGPFSADKDIDPIKPSNVYQLKKNNIGVIVKKPGTLSNRGEMHYTCGPMGTVYIDHLDMYAEIAFFQKDTQTGQFYQVDEITSNEFYIAVRLINNTAVGAGSDIYRLLIKGIYGLYMFRTDYNYVTLTMPVQIEINNKFIAGINIERGHIDDNNTARLELHWTPDDIDWTQDYNALLSGNLFFIDIFKDNALIFSGRSVIDNASENLTTIQSRRGTIAINFEEDWIRRLKEASTLVKEDLGRYGSHAGAIMSIIVGKIGVDPNDFLYYEDNIPIPIIGYVGSNSPFVMDIGQDLYGYVVNIVKNYSDWCLYRNYAITPHGPNREVIVYKPKPIVIDTANVAAYVYTSQTDYVADVSNPYKIKAIGNMNISKKRPMASRIVFCRYTPDLSTMVMKVLSRTEIESNAMSPDFIGLPVTQYVFLPYLMNMSAQEGIDVMADLSILEQAYALRLLHSFHTVTFNGTFLNRLHYYSPIFIQNLGYAVIKRMSINITPQSGVICNYTATLANSDGVVYQW